MQIQKAGLPRLRFIFLQTDRQTALLLAACRKPQTEKIEKSFIFSEKGICVGFNEKSKCKISKGIFF